MLLNGLEGDPIDSGITLTGGLPCHVSPDKEPKIPSQGEKRERELQQLVRRGRKPVALFVDEAHDLHGKTLVGLKRLMEVVADGGGMLSVVLVGHPKLRNDLRRPTMEEVGYRSAIFEFDGMAGHQLPYIRWLLEKCAAEGTSVNEMIDPAAVELLANRLVCEGDLAGFDGRPYKRGPTFSQAACAHCDSIKKLA